MDKSNVQPNAIREKLRCIVTNITYHNADSGWSVLRVQPFNNPHRTEKVIVHQTKVFAGATMEFSGTWVTDPKYGQQFKAVEAIEKKPATSAALEKYLGSGLIKGVGPKTAKKIVAYFGKDTLDIFEGEIQKLTEIPGIAEKKLQMISTAWAEHRDIRNVMIFLQSHGISTLFAVRIYKEYGNAAITLVKENPYRLANDIYGIGFFSADKVALSLGFEKDSPARIMAGVRHVLSSSREFGHCYLTESQIYAMVYGLLKIQGEELLGPILADKLPAFLRQMEQEAVLMVRKLKQLNGSVEPCYYSKSLYFDELYVSKRLKGAGVSIKADHTWIENWLTNYCKHKTITLSDEQLSAVKGIVSKKFSILTGGPGCGKTTTTQVLVKLLESMSKRILLAAPTGRAAQRMSEVIGRESKTIHRLLGWKGGDFQRNEESPLDVDFIIIDECSMLDINISSSLLKAIPLESQILFIGDADQLPSVGAGDVLRDLITSGVIPVFKLTRIFRQARESLIIKYAHQINRGELPTIDTPIKNPELWQQKADCLFLDTDEATQEQLNFIRQVKKHFDIKTSALEYAAEPAENLYQFRVRETLAPYETELKIPPKFLHVDIENLCRAQNQIEELKTVLKKVHPWSSLRYGLSASELVKKLYIGHIPKYMGKHCEIQILSPMTRGSLGTSNLNRLIQEAANPPQEGKREIRIGERIFREGDRVIHRRNNYNLGVFNGDIGYIREINPEDLSCVIAFTPDMREIVYRKEDIVELDLAYAITIHKSQGSEFESVIIPVLPQHFKMLYRNIIYTGLTRAKKMAVFVGSRKALALAVKNQDANHRQTALQELLRS